MAKIQPYYLAYMREHGFDCAEKALKTMGGFHYSNWIMGKWSEFEELNNIKDIRRMSYQREFEAWLCEKIDS